MERNSQGWNLMQLPLQNSAFFQQNLWKRRYPKGIVRDKLSGGCPICWRCWNAVGVLLGCCWHIHTYILTHAHTYIHTHTRARPQTHTGPCRPQRNAVLLIGKNCWDKGPKKEEAETNDKIQMNPEDCARMPGPNCSKSTFKAVNV
eukprot:1154600-Pelagomonas_calceolata.AAC.1